MSPDLTNGTNVGISAVDLGILEDIGMPLRSPTGGSGVNSPPVVTTANRTLAGGEAISLAMFTISDAHGAPITRYQLWDSTRDPNSGHFVVAGVAQPAGTVIDITAAQLAQTFFVARLGIRCKSVPLTAFSGARPIMRPRAPFHVNVT